MNFVELDNSSVRWKPSPLTFSASDEMMHTPKYYGSERTCCDQCQEYQAAAVNGLNKHVAKKITDKIAI